ncbi:CopG family antitoxin [Salinispira pacifica]
MNKDRLDDEEQRIEDSAEEFVPVSQEERDRVERILARSRKTRNINIRLSEEDLTLIRSRAQREGVPYQTLVSSVLHKFVTGQLVDETQVLKAVELLERQNPRTSTPLQSDKKR